MSKIILSAITVLVMFLVFSVYANAQESLPDWEKIGKSGHGEIVYVDLKSIETKKEPMFSSAWFRIVSPDEDVQIRFYTTFEQKAVCFDRIKVNGKVIYDPDKPCQLVLKNTVGYEIFKSLVVFYIVKETKETK